MWKTAVGQVEGEYWTKKLFEQQNACHGFSFMEVASA